MSKDSKNPVELMRAGDRGLVRFRFMYQAELVTPKTAILLREGNAMIIGKITSVIEAEEKVEWNDHIFINFKI